MVDTVENINWAVIKLDDFVKTKSTGGIVVDIILAPENWKDFITYSTFINSLLEQGHIIVKCNDSVKKGWIYTDKTNIFVDSNYSTNT